MALANDELLQLLKVTQTPKWFDHDVLNELDRCLEELALCGSSQLHMLKKPQPWMLVNCVWL